MNLEKRDTQTQMKHEILERYLKTWGGIIARGLQGPYQEARKKGWPFHARFVYVDCFAYIGRYKPEAVSNEIIWGSAIIGVRFLNDIKQYIAENVGFSPDTAAILIEKDHDNFSALLETLRLAGYSSQVRNTDDFFSLKTDEVAVINGDSRDYVHKLLAFTKQKYTKAFYLLDPYGPMGIPLEPVVAPIISQSNNDVMINFPYQDLLKKALSQNQIHEPHKKHYDTMYGNEKWRHVVREYDESSEARKRELEDALVDEYKSVLQGVDNEIAVKNIRLRFPDKERAMFYLFLTTHDGTGGLAMNQILDEAVPREYDLRQQYRSFKHGGQLSLFTFENDPQRPSVSNEPNLDQVADDIYLSCRGETVKYREVLRRLVDSSYYPKDIKGGMKKLKSDKRARYEGELRNNSDVTFK